jgi:hypothetical protein
MIPEQVTHAETLKIAQTSKTKEITLFHPRGKLE